MFNKNQEHYIAIFTKEFIAELEFIINTRWGRAWPRPTFFEQVIGKITLGTNILTTLSTFFPVASVAIGVVGGITTCVATGIKYLYECDMNSNIKRVIDGAEQPAILLHLMIEGVARTAAIRHQFLLDRISSNEDVDRFARVGVARIIRYLSDHKDASFTPENLMKGLIEGKSGFGEQGLSNNKLDAHYSCVKSVSAETVYEHSAVMSFSGKYYTKEQSPHFVKIIKGVPGKLPKAGVMLLKDAEILMYGYSEKTISEKLDEHLCHYRPGYIVLRRADIQNYIATQRSSGASLSLRQLHDNKGIICRDDLSGLDLSGGDFSGVDFSGVKFGIKGCVPTNINNAIFEDAYLVGADMSGVRAEHVHFTHANLSLINAEGAHFNSSNFAGAKVFYSCFTRAEMQWITIIGAEWCGSELRTIICDKAETLAELLKLSKEIHQLKQRQDEQELRLKELEVTVTETWQNQDFFLERSVSTKLGKIKNNICRDEDLKDLKKESELYVPVLAALNTQSVQHFDLKEKAFEFLRSDKKVMLLLGGSGEGKSTFSLHLYKELWAKFTEEKTIAVLISLRNIQNPTTQLLQEYFHGEGFTLDEISFLKSNYSFVFILDGYDEMKSTPNLYTTNQLSSWDAKVIITCRTQFLPQLVNYDRYFKPIQAEKFLDDAFQEVTTVPFNKEQILEYIRIYLKDADPEESNLGSLETYDHEISKIPGLSQLITSPFLLMITMRVMPGIVEKYSNLKGGDRIKITQSALYDAFMQWWFERHERKMLSQGNVCIAWKDTTAELERISEQLAIEMNHADVMEVRYSTSDQCAGKTYSKSVQSREVVSTATAELKDFCLKENILYLLYVRDALKKDEKWRIVGLNSAGSPTYNKDTVWLTVAELARRWSVRHTSIAEHEKEVSEKARALNYAVNQLHAMTPETLPLEIKGTIFEAIILGLSHPWDYFFDLTNPKTQMWLPGIPVKPTKKGGYIFIHDEIRSHLFTKAGKGETCDSAAQSKRKPWDPPVGVTDQLTHHGIFHPVPPTNHARVCRARVAPAPEPKKSCTIS